MALNLSVSFATSALWTYEMEMAVQSTPSPFSARAGNRQVGLLSTLCTYIKSAVQTILLRRKPRALDRPGRAGPDR